MEGMERQEGMDRASGGVTDAEALARIDRYYAGALGCATDDLRTNGWKEPSARSHITRQAAGPFGMRRVVYLLAPAVSSGEIGTFPGVALVADELKSRMKPLLDDFGPRDFYRRAPLMRLDQMVRESVRRLAPGCEPRLDVFYATGGEPRPALSAWADWIEPVEPDEDDPHARALLALHPGGVFVVRIEGAIVAYIGLRPCSSEVWEITQPRLTSCPQTSLIARPDDLFAALIARATRAATSSPATGRPAPPICAITPRDTAVRRALMAAAYKPYASASVYATTTA